MTVTSKTAAARVPEAGVDSLFLERWSPRAFLDTPVEPEKLRALFEAARWAPSSSNMQPWQFVYAAQPADLARFRDTLVESNQAWANRAPVLIIVLARRASSQGPNRWAGFDTGAAWMSLALQAHKLGLSCHAMGGFDPAKALAAVGASAQEFEPMAVVAVGYRGNAQDLPPRLQEREAPTARKSLSDVVKEGRLG